MALFLQRAGQLGVVPLLNDTEAQSLVRLCRLVDGLPLALELAAVWMRTMTLQDVADEVARDLDFLTQTWQNLPERQRSLRVVFEHSWSRLTEEEQQVCSCLAFFRGGIHRAAAIQVAEATPVTLASLVDQSFLRWEADQERYTLHPVLRQYAAEKLAEQPAVAEQIGDQHCAYFARFLHERETALKGAGQRQALDEIAAEIENVRQAWDWAVQRRLEQSLEDSLTSLYLYYEYQGQLREGLAAFSRVTRYWLDESKAYRESMSRVAWKLLLRQAMFELRLGRYAEAKAHFQTCLNILRELNDPEGTCLCLNNLGLMLIFEGTYDRALSLFEESLALARAVQSSDLEEAGLAGIYSVYWYQGRFAEYEEFANQLLHKYRRMGDRLNEGELLTSLGNSSLSRDNIVLAKSCYEQALQISREIGNRLGEGLALIGMGTIYQYQSVYEEAENHYHKSLAIYREVGHLRYEGLVLINLGHLYQLLGDFHAAQKFFLQALSLFQTIGFKHGLVRISYGLGRLSHAMQDITAAQNYGYQIQTLTQASMDRLGQFYAFEIMGQAWAALQQPTEAIASFQQGIALGEQLNLTSLVLPVRAALAEVYRAQEDLIQAHSQVEEILKYQNTTTLEECVEDPCQVYLACYRVLKAGRDPRTLPILQTAHRILQDRAAHIGDEQRRRLFLENISAHREILVEVSALADATNAASGPATNSTLVEPLTDRELEVLRLMAEGLANAEIAERLVLGLATIKTHAHRVFAKLNVRNRAQAIRRAKELDLL